MALLQVALATAFMLVFHFPPFVIVISGVVIVVSTWVQARRGPLTAGSRPRIPQAPSSQPVSLRILNAVIGLCGVLFVVIFMFGFVIFMNSWSRWQRMEGAAYHASSFQVVRVYYQQNTSSTPGGPKVFASGMVEGKKEWMNLLAYLKTTPHDQAELNDRVPEGTVILVYLFPELKGQSRIQVLGPVPPAEANHKQAIWALNHGLASLAVIGGVMFLLIRIRRSCFATSQSENPLACVPTES